MLDLREPDRATFADLGRTRIRLWDWGDERAPAVLLVHGGWDHGRMYDGIAPEIAAMGARVVAVDLRGHGDSGRLGIAGAAWQAWNLDLARIARTLGPPIGFLGHSLGGGQVLTIASAFPELVKWVVNLDGLGPAPEMMIVEDHAAMAARWLEDAEKVWWEPQREYASIEEMAERRVTINRRLPFDWALHLARHGSTRGPGGGLVWKSDPVLRIGSPAPFREETLRAQYRVIRSPVVALTGGEDDQWSDLPDELIQSRLAAIPGVEHHVVPGAGHYIHIERPDAVLAQVERLLT